MSDCKPTLESLVDDFDKMPPTEKAAVLRFLAGESADPEARRRLIVHALRWDAIALAEDR